MYHILVCDDDRDIVSALRIYLSQEDCVIHEAYTGEEALRVLHEREIHLVLMDIMMPGMDGIQATARLREEFNMPVILLTAKSEDTDKVLGLSVGADDYVTKPFNPVEVIARVKSQLRRYTVLGGQERRPDRIVLGGIELDDGAKTVSVDGEPVSLTPTEFAILRLLMQDPGRVYSSSAIYAAVSGGLALGTESSVAVHIRHLREKLEIEPSDPRYIKVVWGQGYKFEGGVK